MAQKSFELIYIYIHTHTHIYIYISYYDVNVMKDKYRGASKWYGPNTPQILMTIFSFLWEHYRHFLIN